MKNITYALLTVVVAVIFISSATHFISGINKNSLALVSKSGVNVETPEIKTSKPIFQFIKTMPLGEDSPNVLALQMFLKNEGFLDIERETTYFGSKTSHALARYQASEELPVTGVLDVVTIANVNDEIQTLSNQITNNRRCTQFSKNQMAGWTFPPSPVTPPLPSEDPHIWIPDTYDCDNFAQNFCERLKAIDPAVNCSYVEFDHHAINIIEYTDSNGVAWVCVVEPQGNKFHCMKKSEWDGLPDGWKKWIQEKMCREFYNMPKEECDLTVTNPQKYYGSCSNIIGTSCDGSGILPNIGYCSDPSYIPPPGSGQNKGFRNIVCDCDFVDGQAVNCKWEQATVPVDDVPPELPPVKPIPSPNGEGAAPLSPRAFY